MKAAELFSVPEALPAEFRRGAAASAFERGDHALECPNCANHWALSALRQAAAGLSLEPQDLLFISEGRLCGGWASCFNSYALEAAGGRALPLALGAKLANPGLYVVTAGDEADFGAFARTARREPGLLYLRVVPPRETAPRENWMALALASGAGFAARIRPGASERTGLVLTRALQHRGFAFVECAAKSEGEASVLGNPRPGERELPLALALAVSPLGLKAEGIFFWAAPKEPESFLTPLKTCLNLSPSQKAEILRSFL